MYGHVKQLIGTSKELPDATILLMYGDQVLEESTNPIHVEIFDGIELRVALITISVHVNTNQRTYTINISPVSYLRLIA